jgi:hypothetical protein
MPQIPEPSNPAVLAADQLLELLILEIAFNKIISVIAGGNPLLQLPIIDTIYAWAMKQLGNLIFKPFQDMVANGIISIQINAQDAEYTAAKAALLKAHQAGDSNAIEQAKTVAKAKLADLIHFGHK